ncbi:FecR domain-containing protein [Arcobacter sp.]|uniref:FecR domain-containing protein n=1 Tax=unclassified Arcobacter TaxID=2593671 RepID=UPI003AFF633E
MKKILLLLFILISFSFASIGQITALVGDVKISRDSNTILAKLGEKLEKNDVINSSKGSKAQITMNDNTIITIGQNSTLNIFDYVYDESKPKDSKASFGFIKGSFKSITGAIGKINKERFKLRTKSATIGIRGTTIIGNQQIIICTDGAISVTANNFTVNVDKQEFTRLPQGKAPTPPEPLKQDTLDNVQKGLNAESSDSNTTESKETKESTTSTEEEKAGAKDDEGGTLTTSGNDDGTTPKKKVTTPKENIAPPKILEDTPPLNPDKPEIQPDIPTEHISFSGFSTLGYVSFVTISNNQTVTSLQTGEIGFTENNDYRMIANKKNITDVIFTVPEEYYSDQEEGNYLGLGYWWGVLANTTNYDGGYYLRGLKTDASYISSLMNNASKTTKSFTGSGGEIKGKILDDNTSYDIDSDSVMNFKFDFGAGINSFSGSMNLKYGEIGDKKNYAIGFADGKINSSGYSSKLTHEGEEINGSLHGSFYGSGIKGFGGSVNFDDGKIKGTGVFRGKF